MLKLGIYAGLTALGFLFATQADRAERSEAMRVSTVVSISWLLCAMPWIYEPASLAGLLYRAGLHSVEHEQTWAAVDAIASIVALRLSRGHVWGWIIWAAYIGMMCCHVAYEVLNWVGSPLEYSAYTGGLDAAYTAQLAMLLLLGEGGVRNRVSRGIRSLRGVHGSRLSPHLEG